MKNNFLRKDKTMNEDTKRLALELRDAIKILTGNVTTSIPSNSSHSYSAWTTYRDYVVEVKDEFLQNHPDIAKTYKPLFGHTSSYNGADARFSWSLVASESAKIENPEHISIEDTPKGIKEEILKIYLPQCNEEDKYCFMFGKEKGEELYNEELWIKGHIMGNESVTRAAVEAIGHFEFNGEPYRHNGKSCYPIIDEKGKEHIVSTRRDISAHDGYYYTFDIEDDTRKEYARKCGKLSRKYKLDFVDVLRLGTDKEILEKYQEQLLGAMDQIKHFSQKDLDYYSHELFACGRDRRECALAELGITVPSEQFIDVNHMTFSQLGTAIEERQEEIDIPRRLVQARKKLEEERLSESGVKTSKDSHLVYTTRDDSQAHKTLIDNPVLVNLQKDMGKGL